MKAHGLLEQGGNRYAYCFTELGVTIAGLFVLFHKHLSEPWPTGPFSASVIQKNKRQTRIRHRQSKRLPPKRCSTFRGPHGNHEVLLFII
jgi:hypothetical protein